MQINATVDYRIIYIPIIKTCCIWLKVLNLLPTSSCLFNTCTIGRCEVSENGNKHFK